jgi:hypothetical protein
MGVAKNLYVGGTLNVTGNTSFTNPVINNIKMGYSTTATAAGTTTLTVASNYRQFFTGTLAQTIVLPVTSTLVTGMAYEIENNSTGLLTVNSSGGNLVGTVPAGVCAHAVCIGTTLTTAADWDWDYISTTTITGTGANVLGTSPTITTPTISSLSSAAATALTLQSAGTTAITVDTSQNVAFAKGFTVGATAFPAFSAYLSSAQSFTVNVVTKVTCQTEEFDTNNNYDNATNYRFTPTVAGYYQVSACISVASAAAQIATYIYKNGSKWKQGSNYANGFTGSISCLVYCNGSTDYIEFYGAFSSTQNASSNLYDTAFQAVMVRSA